MATLVGLLDPVGFGIGDILIVVLPASIVGLLVACFVQMRVGKELDDDPEYQRRVAAGEIPAVRRVGARGAGAAAVREAQHDDLPRRDRGDRGARDGRAAAPGVPGRGRQPRSVEHRDHHPDRDGRGRDGDRPDLPGEHQGRRRAEHDDVRTDRSDRPVRDRLVGRHVDRGERDGDRQRDGRAGRQRPGGRSPSRSSSSVR